MCFSLPEICAWDFLKLLLHFAAKVIVRERILIRVGVEVCGNQHIAVRSGHVIDLIDLLIPFFPHITSDKTTTTT